MVRADRFKNEILTKYTPTAQETLCADTDSCFFGDHPTLATLNKNYGNRAGAIWLVPQITDCVAFTNNRGILDDRQTKSLASLIASEYYYLKVSELMLFFRRFKLGKYREIYGNFSPMAITLSIRDFLVERNNEYFKHDAELDEKRRNESKKGAMTYKEYQKENYTQDKYSWNLDVEK